jgi:hypothetical protein
MRRGAAALALLAVAGVARAQTMLDQEQRLIDIHALLLDLPAVEAPGALRAGEIGVGVELIGIPPIDGTTGTKRQITASDRTPVFPRPRLVVGLPAPAGFAAFAGASYIPPISVDDVSSHFGAAEVGIAYAPGRLRVGVRGHVSYAESQSPVTDASTRDALRTFDLGGDLSAGVALALPFGSATPYGGIGLTRVDGRFRVTSDGVVLTSRYTGLALHAGLRLLVKDHWEGVGELDAYPGRLIHPSFRLAYVVRWGGR